MKTIFQGPGNFHVSLGGERKGVLWRSSDLEGVEGTTPHVGGLGVAFPLLALLQGSRVVSGVTGLCITSPRILAGSKLLQDAPRISP